MRNERSPWFPTAGRTTQIALIVGSALLAFAPVLVAAWVFGGRDSAVAAGLAGGICALSAASGWLIRGLFPGTTAIAYRTLASMVLRMGIPLAFCIVVALNSSRLRESGLVQYMIIAYLLALTADTLLSVAMTSTSNTAKRVT